MSARERSEVHAVCMVRVVKLAAYTADAVTEIP
jgi:hypothetical protein